MLDPELLEILVCPESKEAVELADDALLARVNAAIESGSLTNRGGAPVGEIMDSALVRADGKVLYPIREGIPIMLIDESIATDSLA